MAAEQVLSVGIDIGTSTTQVVFSRLKLENTAGYFSVPRVAIVDKTILYRGEIHETPLADRLLIDADAVRGLIAEEFRRAGYTPAETDTGAVIITGETARKANAELVLEKLSDFAGEFVVSTAGPDLEAIIAGKGSGAWQYSLDHAAAAVNLDVGGGTTNIVMFRNGEVAAKGCVDIGGRQVRLDGGKTVTYVSPSAALIAADAGIVLAEGRAASEENLRAVCRRMADLLWDLASGNQSELLVRVTTAGSSDYRPSAPADAVFFSGGVADCIYNLQENLYAYGDIGVLLGQEIRNNPRFSHCFVVQPNETIRATVIGAGSYTTTVSGSTIFYSEDLFPQKNLPVLKLTCAEQQECLEGSGEALEEKLRWLFSQTDSNNIAVAFPGVQSPSYSQLKNMADAICLAVENVYRAETPLILLIETDMAKALGQTVFRRMGGRPVVCLDSVKVEPNDFVDMGRPLMGGIVIPVVVKTLIFG